MMKKNVLFAFAALIAVSSCTSEINEEGFVDKANSISFNAYSNKSRALTTDITSDNMKGDNFGVAGYTGSSIYLYKLDKTVNKAVEQNWVEGTKTWEYADLSDLRFWPNTAMDFYAYYPFTDAATFSSSNTNGTVMTIPSVDCTHDVLFAYAGNQSKKDRVPLTFHHAFAKMMTLKITMPDGGNLSESGCHITVQNVEFINTSTKGNINVDYQGIASYTVAGDDKTLANEVSPVVTVNKTTNSGTLIDNGTSAKGYFFATNSTTEVNKVIGTGKNMWNGVKTSIGGGTLSSSNLVCLKLTCKVWNGTDAKRYDYVGDENNYGVIYIPLTGSKSDQSAVTTFDAGKRYNYTIEMKNNVGYDDNGDPILTPILFEVNSVVNWETVNVTITL